MAHVVKFGARCGLQLMCEFLAEYSVVNFPGSSTVRKWARSAGLVLVFCYIKK